MIKKIALHIIKGCILFVLFGLLYLLFAFILSRITVNQDIEAPEEVEIYILTNGIHTDLVVPTHTDHINWFSEFDFLERHMDMSMYKHLAIGWGDKGFYLNTPSWSELKVSTALKACIGVSGTALHVTYYKEMHEGKSCRRLMVSDRDYVELIRYILNSIKKDQNNKAIRIITSANRGDLDAFYEAKGRYHIFNTCNTWANRGLKYARQKACLWTIFQEPIFMKYKIEGE